jgi:hypothetical protein
MANHGNVVQLVERRSDKAKVGSSSLSITTMPR